MNDTTTTTQPAETAKVKSIMDIRTPIFFDTVDAVSAYLNKIGTETNEDGTPNVDYHPDFGNAPMVLNGVDGEGNFDAAIYTDDMQVMFHVLKNRGKTSTDAAGNEVKAPATLRAVIVTPAPKQSAVEADKTGAEWLSSIFRTQITKTACDPIRNAADLKLASKDMPLTLADFVTSTRESGSVYEVFDDLYKPIIALFNEKSASFKRARLNKSEFKKALESRAYALDVYPKLEDRGDKPSLFVMALMFAQKEAEAQSKDATVFKTWLDNRDEAAASDDTETDELDELDSLEGLSLNQPTVTTEAAPEAEAEAVTQEVEPTEENTAPVEA